MEINQENNEHRFPKFSHPSRKKGTKQWTGGPTSVHVGYVQSLLFCVEVCLHLLCYYT